jgi:hypothetical protein
MLVLQRWLHNGGYTGAPAFEVDLTTSTPELMGTLVRFMQWYAAGRPGDPVKERRGGSQVGSASGRVEVQAVYSPGLHAAGTGAASGCSEPYDQGWCLLPPHLLGFLTVNAAF